MEHKKKAKGGRVMRILIVEDNEPQLELLKKLLENEEFQVTGCVDGLVAGDFALILHNVSLLLPFGVGVALGIFAIAKIIEYLFAHFPSQTFAGIIGLILSSPFAVLYSSGALASFTVPGLIVGLVLGAAGAWVTLLMGKADPE